MSVAFTETFTTGSSLLLPATYPTSDSGHSWTSSLGLNLVVNNGVVEAGTNSSNYLYINTPLVNVGTDLVFVCSSPASSTTSSWIIEVGASPTGSSGSEDSVMLSYSASSCKLYRRVAGTQTELATLFTGTSTSKTWTLTISGTGLTISGSNSGSYTFGQRSSSNKLFFRAYGAGSTGSTRPSIDSITAAVLSDGDQISSSPSTAFGAPVMFPMNDDVSDSFSGTNGTLLTAHALTNPSALTNTPTWAESGTGDYTLTGSLGVVTPQNSDLYAYLQNVWLYRLPSIGTYSYFSIDAPGSTSYLWTMEFGGYASPASSTRHSVRIERTSSTAVEIREFTDSTTSTLHATLNNTQCPAGSYVDIEINGTDLYVYTTGGSFGPYTMTYVFPRQLGLIPFWRSYGNNATSTNRPVVRWFETQVQEFQPPTATGIDPTTEFGTPFLLPQRATGWQTVQFGIPAMPLAATGSEFTQSWGTAEAFQYYGANGTLFTQWGLANIYPFYHTGSQFTQSWGTPSTRGNVYRAYEIRVSTQIPRAYYAFDQVCVQTGVEHTRYGNQGIVLQEYILRDHVAESVLRPVLFGTPFHSVEHTQANVVAYKAGKINGTTFGTPATPVLVAAAARGIRSTRFGTAESLHKVTQAHGIHRTRLGKPALLDRVIPAADFSTTHFGTPGLLHRRFSLRAIRGTHVGRPSLLDRTIYVRPIFSTHYGRPGSLHYVVQARGWLYTHLGLPTAPAEQGVTTGFKRTRYGSHFSRIGGYRTYGWRRTIVSRPTGISP